MSTRKAFQHAVTVRNVVARTVEAMDETAMDFSTPEALEKYLKAHPKADKGRHTVMGPERRTEKSTQKRDEKAKAKQEHRDQETQKHHQNLDQGFEDLARKNGLTRDELAYQFAKNMGLNPRQHMDPKVVDEIEATHAKRKSDPMFDLQKKIDSQAMQTGKTREQVIEDAVNRGMGLKG
jgi:AraC-like DNA-binding protein